MRVERGAATLLDRLIREGDAYGRTPADALVCEWSRVVTKAFDERAARDKVGVAFGAFGNFDRAAGATIWHLASGAIRRSGGHAPLCCGLGDRRGGSLRFVVKESILHRYFDAAIFSIDPEFGPNLGV